MASHRRATITDGEIDGVVQLPLLSLSLSSLHPAHTSESRRTDILIFHSATFNLQINPSEKIPWLVGSVSNSILHFIVSGISKCSSSLTH
jgi:hypothetical protein